MLMSFLIVVLSWSARNYFNVDASKPTGSDRALGNLIIGSHDNFYDIWRKNSKDDMDPAKLDNREVRGSISKFSIILYNRIKEQPVKYAKWYFIEKPYLLWSWSILTGQGDIHIYTVRKSLYDKNRLALISYSIMKSVHLWLFFFSLMGLFFLFKRNNGENKIEVGILYIILIYVSSVYVVLQSEPRYSIPLRPEMYLCAMFFLSELVRHYKKHKIKRVK